MGHRLHLAYLYKEGGGPLADYHVYVDLPNDQGFRLFPGRTDAEGRIRLLAEQGHGFRVHDHHSYCLYYEPIPARKLEEIWESHCTKVIAVVEKAHQSERCVLRVPQQHQRLRVKDVESGVLLPDAPCLLLPDLGVWKGRTGKEAEIYARTGKPLHFVCLGPEKAWQLPRKEKLSICRLIGLRGHKLDRVQGEVLPVSAEHKVAAALDALADNRSFARRWGSETEEPKEDSGEKLHPEPGFRSRLRLANLLERHLEGNHELSEELEPLLRKQRGSPWLSLGLGRLAGGSRHQETIRSAALALCWSIAQQIDEHSVSLLGGKVPEHFAALVHALELAAENLDRLAASYSQPTRICLGYAIAQACQSLMSVGMPVKAFEGLESPLSTLLQAMAKLKHRENFTLRGKTPQDWSWQVSASQVPWKDWNFLETLYGHTEIKIPLGVERKGRLQLLHYGKDPDLLAGHSPKSWEQLAFYLRRILAVQLALAGRDSLKEAVSKAWTDLEKLLADFLSRDAGVGNILVHRNYRIQKLYSDIMRREKLKTAGLFSMLDSQQSWLGMINQDIQAGYAQVNAEARSIEMALLPVITLLRTPLLEAQLSLLEPTERRRFRTRAVRPFPPYFFMGETALGYTYLSRYIRPELLPDDETACPSVLWADDLDGADPSPGQDLRLDLEVWHELLPAWKYYRGPDYETKLLQGFSRLLGIDATELIQSDEGLANDEKLSAGEAALPGSLSRLIDLATGYGILRDFKLLKQRDRKAFDAAWKQGKAFDGCLSAYAQALAAKLGELKKQEIIAVADLELQPQESRNSYGFRDPLHAGDTFTNWQLTANKPQGAAILYAQLAEELLLLHSAIGKRLTIARLQQGKNLARAVEQDLLEACITNTKKYLGTLKKWSGYLGKAADYLKTADRLQRGLRAARLLVKGQTAYKLVGKWCGRILTPLAILATTMGLLDAWECGDTVGIAAGAIGLAMIAAPFLLSVPGLGWLLFFLGLGVSFVTSVFGWTAAYRKATQLGYSSDSGMQKISSKWLVVPDFELVRDRQGRWRLLLYWSRARAKISARFWEEDSNMDVSGDGKILLKSGGHTLHDLEVDGHVCVLPADLIDTRLRQGLIDQTESSYGDWQLDFYVELSASQNFDDSVCPDPWILTVNSKGDVLKATPNGMQLQVKKIEHFTQEVEEIEELKGAEWLFWLAPADIKHHVLCGESDIDLDETISWDADVMSPRDAYRPLEVRRTGFSGSGVAFFDKDIRTSLSWTAFLEETEIEFYVATKVEDTPGSGKLIGYRETDEQIWNLKINSQGKILRAGQRSFQISKSGQEGAGWRLQLNWDEQEAPLYCKFYDWDTGGDEQMRFRPRKNVITEQVFLFGGSQMVCWHSKAHKELWTKELSSAIRGLPPSFHDGIDAAVNDGKRAWLVRGERCILFDPEKMQIVGEPRFIHEIWPSDFLAKGFDAALQWDDGKLYFFKGREYVRVSPPTSESSQATVDEGYPKPIAEGWDKFPFLKDGINAAVNVGGNRAYFFKDSLYHRTWTGGRYARFADQRYGEGRTLPGGFAADALSSGVDAALTWNREEFEEYSSEPLKIEVRNGVFHFPASLFSDFKAEDVVNDDGGNQHHLYVSVSDKANMSGAWDSNAYTVYFSEQSDGTYRIDRAEAC